MPEFSESRDKLVNSFRLLVNEKLQTRYKMLLGQRRGLIIGDVQSGKTSLYNYMLQGHPGDPEPTVGFVNSQGKPVPIERTWYERLWETAKEFISGGHPIMRDGGFMFLQRDFSGELMYAVPQMLAEYKPEIIIYMVDARAGLVEGFTDPITGFIAPSIEQVARDACVNLFQPVHLNSYRVTSFAVFLNFMDQWNGEGSTTKQKRKEAEFQGALADAFDMADLDWPGDKVNIYAVQLSPEKDHWPELERALTAVLSK